MGTWAGCSLGLWLLASLTTGTAAAQAQHHDNGTSRVWVCMDTDKGIAGSGARTLITEEGKPEYGKPPDCTQSLSSSIICTGSPPTVPDAIQTPVTSVVMLYYCDTNDKSVFGTGQKVRVSECGQDGQWTKVRDVCMRPCEAPRDCCDVVNLGFDVRNDNNGYLVSSSATQETWIRVVCSSGNNNSGYLKILYHTENSTDLNVDYQRHKFGVGDPHSTKASYFLGISYLADMTKDVNGEPKPMVMLVNMKDSSDNVLHASYDSVVVNSTDLTLTSLGNYYGNAGDMLSESLGQPYCASTSTSSNRLCWWGDNTIARKSFLTSDQPKWGDKNLTSVGIWIRPQECDTERSCPHVLDPSLVINEDDLSSLRNPGITIPFTCAQELMVVKGSLEPKGAVTCTAIPGQTPQWVADECQLECPNDYIMSQDETACFKFTTEKGHVMQALDRCVDEGAYLPYISDKKDLFGAINDTYYMGSVITTNITIFPPIENASTYADLNFTVVRDYSNSALSKCINLANPGLYTARNCQEKENIACMKPAKCPPEYRLVEGRCFRLMQSSTQVSFLESLKKCNAEGSALAYPQTVATIVGLTRMATKEIEWNSVMQPVNIALGLNLMFGDLTADGLYNPDIDVIKKVNESGLTSNDYTFLTVQTSKPRWSLTTASTNASTQHFFCEFHGPTGCTMMSNPHVGNMTYTGVFDITSQSFVGQILSYTCIPGYFVGGELGNKTPQYMKCKGQLGGWVSLENEEPLSSLIPCIGVIACNETIEQPPMESEYMWIWYQTNHRFDTHKFSYNCKKAGMTTESGEHSQIFTCTEYNGTYAYDRQNVSQCNRCFDKPKSKYKINFSWNDSYLIGDQLQATCKPRCQTAAGVDTQIMNCTVDGWQVLPCYMVCLDEPSVTQATTNWISEAQWAEGSSVLATCLDNHFFIHTKTQTRTVTCVNGAWESEPGCQQVCSGEPTVNNATVELLNRLWTVGELAQVTCDPGYRFEAEASDEAKVECTAAGWEDRQGCVKVCLDKPTAANAQINWSANDVHPVGVTVTATCLPNYALIPSNVSTHQLQCQADGWYVESECKLLCLGAPQVDNATTDWDETQAWGEGDLVNATCINDHHFSKTLVERQSVECIGGVWNVTDSCQEAVVVPMCAPEPIIDNAQTNWTNKPWRYGDLLTAQCRPNFFFKSTLADGTEVYQREWNVQCHLNGWDNVGQCERVVGTKCIGSTPTVATSSTVLSHTWTDTSTYMVDEFITFTCKDGYLHLPDGAKDSTLKCDFEGWEVTTGCQRVCEDEPTVVEGDTTWNSGKVWPVGSFVTATCKSDFRLLPDGNQTQQIQCTDQGWETSAPCQTVCLGKPGFGNLSLVWPSSGAWGIDQNQTVLCPSGYLATDASDSATYICKASGWSTHTTCQKACIEIPALVTESGREWLGEAWFVGAKVNISCPDSHLTPQGSTNVTHDCTDDGWTNSSYCIKVCLPPTNQPENMTWPEGVYEVGSVLNVSCPASYLTRDANSHTSYSCSDSGWTNPRPCIRMCLTEPEVNNSITEFDRRDLWAEGDQVKVWCLPDHQVRPGVTYYSVPCTNTGWKQDQPQCQLSKWPVSSIAIIHEIIQHKFLIEISYFM